ncbi:ABC transporter substrate-binding protein [Paenibacillus hamazuiensis]|uniref:ABC transporter substrate-binding protein n=1 Tax=Paenibacillus hamazuiensis TaxID=2936508 RepID=UPI00200D2275|nr:ABC transporter substrate-binding protein [Paenibacillus hamazuiensis]
MRKKSFGTLTSILLAGALFAGCSSSPAPAANNTAGAGGNSKDSLPPYEITMVYQAAEPKDLKEVEAAISKITKEKINATVKLLPISNGTWQQQINLMLTANEKMDLLWTASSLGYINQVAKGQLIPIDELLDKHGPDIKASLDKGIMDSLKIKGKIYSVPSIKDWAASAGIVMRKDMVDKYKIDTTKIKTLDDLEPIFKTIKDNEPGMIPVTGTTGTLMELIYNGDIDRLDNYLGVLMDVTNLKVSNLYESKPYADLAERMRKWYLEGYISKDAATNTETGYNLVKANKAFSFYGSLKPGFDEDVLPRTGGVKMVSVPLTGALATTSKITNALMVIPKNSQNPERAMMFLNMLYSDKTLINLLDYGIEGKHYVKAGDNIIDYPQDVNASNVGYYLENWKIGNSFNSYTFKVQDPNTWKNIDEFNKTALKSKALGFSFDGEPVKTELAAVSNVLSSYKTAIEFGAIDPKTALPDFISRLKAAGIDKIIAEKQKQLDEWASSRK